MKFFPILLVAVSVFAVSCERHEFEGPDGTKQLHEHHGAHAAEPGEHAAEHAEHTEKAAEPAH
ncbi:MAG: hypothetical protein ABI162_16800 [Luteolibacter sp.]